MMDKKVITGIFAAIGGSLCCITPVIAVLAGTTGLASTFSFMEPLRPIFITITVVFLAYAWWSKLKPKQIDLECACEPNENGKEPFVKTKSFLALVTVLSAVLLTVPYWGSSIIENTQASKPKVVYIEKSNIKESVIGVEGMTCPSCESIVEKVANELDGVIKTVASTPEKSATVTYDSSKVNIEDIVKAINKTGYKTTGYKSIKN
jgi:copper chaperone CopZ